MEYAALLAGEPWTDQPRCTHPVLAALARLANDATTPTGRYRLVPLIPYVVGANPDDLHTAPAIVRAAITTVRPAAARGRSLRRHQRRAGRRLRRIVHQPPTLIDRWRGKLYERGPAMRALESVLLATRRLPPEVRDEMLRTALVAAIGAVRAKSPFAPAAAGIRNPTIEGSIPAPHVAAAVQTLALKRRDYAHDLNVS
jgi:hypothetical protein